MQVFEMKRRRCRLTYMDLSKSTSLSDALTTASLRPQALVSCEALKLASPV